MYVDIIWKDNKLIERRVLWRDRMWTIINC